VFTLDELSRRLHAKLYLLKIRGSWKLIIGSSNFTESGLNSNLEANVLIEPISERQKGLIFSENQFCGQKISQVTEWEFKAEPQNYEEERIDELIEFVYSKLDWDDEPSFTKQEKLKIGFDATKVFPNQFGLEEIKICHNPISKPILLNQSNIKDNFELNFSDLGDREELEFEISFKDKSFIISISLQNLKFENLDYQLLCLLDCKQQVKSHVINRKPRENKETHCETENITSGKDHVIMIGNYLSKLRRNQENGEFSNSTNDSLAKLLEFVKTDEKLGNFREVIIKHIKDVSRMGNQGVE
jgi:hypothetical protein